MLQYMQDFAGVDLDCVIKFLQNEAHEVVYILRSLIEKAIEWNIHIFVLDGDLHKAYDAPNIRLASAEGRQKRYQT